MSDFFSRSLFCVRRSQALGLGEFEVTDIIDLGRRNVRFVTLLKTAFIHGEEGEDEKGLGLIGLMAEQSFFMHDRGEGKGDEGLGL